MKLWVGNATLQRFEFGYRLVGSTKRTRYIVIEPMSQGALPDDLTKEELDSVIEQHEPYGFVNTKALTAGTTPKIQTKLVYSIDSPVGMVMLDHLFNLNKGILTEFGRELRKQAAVVSNDALNRAMENQRRQGLDAEVGSVELTVQQEELPNGGYRDEETPVGDGFVVTTEQDHDKPTTSRRRAR